MPAVTAPPPAATPAPSASVARITPASPRLARHLDPLAMARALWARRGLAWLFVRREVEGRYRGSLLGIFWSFIHPVVMLGLFTFVGGVVFRARWPGARTGTLGEFALFLFTGLVAFNVLSECATRAVGLVLAVPNFVKRVVFPLEVLPLAVVGAALFHGALGLVVLLGFTLAARGSLPATVLLLPLVALPLVFLCLGLSWLLASLGVFVRDLAYVVPLALQVLFFATPVIYPAESVPPPLRAALALNPLAFVVEGSRDAIFHGKAPEAAGVAVWTAATAAFMVAGYAWFMKTRRGFADVM
jgi:lipopolysaccharide transport system permease protein